MLFPNLSGLSLNSPSSRSVFSLPILISSILFIFSSAGLIINTSPGVSRSRCRLHLPAACAIESSPARKRMTEQKEKKLVQEQQRILKLEEKTRTNAQNTLRWRQRLLLFKSFLGVIGVHKTPEQRIALAKENLLIEKERLRLEEERKLWNIERKKREKQEIEREHMKRIKEQQHIQQIQEQQEK